MPSAGVLLLQKLCQHGENESKRKRAHNEMRNQPPLVQVTTTESEAGLPFYLLAKSQPQDLRLMMGYLGIRTS